MSRILRTRRARLTAASGSLLVAAVIAATVSGSASPAHADPTASANTVSVSGTGKATATPDVMHVDLGVQRSGQDLNQTLSDANADLTRIKEALGKHGVKDADIQTSQLSINQHYGPIQPMATPDAVAPPMSLAPSMAVAPSSATATDDGVAVNTATPAVAPMPPPDAPVSSPATATDDPAVLGTKEGMSSIAAAPPVYIDPKDQNRPNGYDVYETVAVTLRNLSDAGATISDAAAAGGDTTRINGVSFAIDDQTRLLQQARDAAFADAKAKAEQYAKLAGRGLGKVSVITEGQSSDGGGVVYPMERSAMSTGNPVPIAAGSQDVTLTTNVTWELN
jgi:uncharacterized protein YggE